MKTSEAPPSPSAARRRTARTTMRRRRWGRVTWMLPVVLAGIANVGVLWNDFAYDDVRVLKLLREHRVTLTGEPVTAATPGVPATPPMRDEETRPLPYAVHLLDYRVWGDRAFGFHLTSLLSHMLATALVFAAAALFAESTLPALLAALVFAVHPLHVEVVASFVNLKDTLALVFDLIALLAWARIRPRAPRLIVTGVALALGFASKEVAVAGLPVLLLAAHGLLGAGHAEARPRPWQLWMLRALAGALGSMVVAGLVWGNRLPYFDPVAIGNATEQQLHDYPTALANAALGVLRLAERLILPIRLSADYPLAPDAMLTSPAVLLGLGVLAALVLVPLGLYPRRPRTALAAAWLIVMYLPISNLVPLVHFYAADRYAYVPSFGYCVLFGLAIAWLGRRVTTPAAQRAIFAAVGAVLVLLTAQTVRRIAEWKDDLSLWSAAARDGYETYRIRKKLGVALLLAGDANADSAARELSRAIALRPGITEDHAWLAGAAFTAGHPEVAWREANAVLRADPRDAVCHFIRAEMLLERGDTLQALTDYRATIAADSLHFGAMMRVGSIDLARAAARPEYLDEAAAMARLAARSTAGEAAQFQRQAYELGRRVDAARREPGAGR